MDAERPPSRRLGHRGCHHGLRRPKLYTAKAWGHTVSANLLAFHSATLASAVNGRKNLASTSRSLPRLPQLGLRSLLTRLSCHAREGVTMAQFMTVSRRTACQRRCLGSGKDGRRPAVRAGLVALSAWQRTVAASEEASDLLTTKSVYCDAPSKSRSSDRILTLFIVRD
jgi:hypothetical protein